MNEVSLRASSLPELLDCPARWHAKQVLGMRLPSSPEAALGKAVHAGAAAFDKSVQAGDPIKMHDAAEISRNAILHPDEEVDWSASTEIDRSDATGMAGLMTGIYIDNIGAWKGGRTGREDDDAPVERRSFIKIEETLQPFVVVNRDGSRVTLTGTPDRIYQQGEDLFGIADIKTGKSASGGRDHRAQLAVYEVLAKYSMGIDINAPAFVLGVKSTGEFFPDSAGYPLADGLMFGGNAAGGLMQYVFALMKAEIFPGNPKSVLCSKKYCPAHGICRWR